MTEDPQIGPMEFLFSVKRIACVPYPRIALSLPLLFIKVNKTLYKGHRGSCLLPA